MIIKIPLTFADDHDIARELPSGTRIHADKRHATYDVTREDLQAWLSDAEFYADREYWLSATGGVEGYAEILYLVRSAERSLPIIRAAIDSFRSTFS